VGGVARAWERPPCRPDPNRRSPVSGAPRHPRGGAIRGERNGAGHGIGGGQPGYSLPRPTPQKKCISHVLPGPPGSGAGRASQKGEVHGMFRPTQLDQQEDRSARGGVSGAWGHWLSGRMVCVQFKGRASLPSPQNAAIHGERNGLDHEIRDGQRGYSLPRPTPQRNHSYPKKRPRAQRVTPGSRRTSGPRGPGIPRGCTRLSSSGRPAEVSCLGGAT